VTAFLTYCKLRGFRDDDYGIARLTQVIANYFGGGLSIGITAHPGQWVRGCDNGMYVIKEWNIVKHLDMDEDGHYIPYDHEYHEGYNITEMLIDIDNAQPEADRLGEAEIRKAIGG
jgi:hypothetical protein